MNKPIKLRLRVLSPIHIGCDEAYEPTQFVVDENNDQIRVFHPMDFIQTLSRLERKQFVGICNKGTEESIRELYKFFRDKNSRSPVPGRPVKVCKEFVSHYRKILESRDRREINQFVLERTAFDPATQKPCIPGSALKGALRTAYLNQLAHGRNFVREYKNNYKKAKDLEKRLLGGNFNTDPFRLVKVSDFHLAKEAETCISYAVNIRKNSPTIKEGKGPLQILEVVSKDSIFEGTLKIEFPPPKANIKTPITEDSLIQASQYYEVLLKDEYGLFNRLKISTRVKREVEEIRDKLGKTSLLIRLGRHSGAEAVTIKGCRSIRIMRGRNRKPDFSDHATTIWLASEERKPQDGYSLEPFGWCVLERADGP